MSAVSFNLANYNRAMSEHSRRTTNSIGSFYGKSFKTRVTTNNVRGKPQDKLTADQLSPKRDPHLTNYNEEFSKKPNGQRLEQIKSHRNVAINDAGLVSPSQVATTRNAGSNVQEQLEAKRVAALNPKEGNSVQTANQQQQLEEIKRPKTKQVVEQRSALAGGETANRNFNSTNFDTQSIRDEIKKSFLSNPYVKVDDEAEYYETVRRLDVCGSCWTGQQKYYSNPFKLKQKTPGVTLYQKDFVKHPLDGKDPVLKNDFYTTFHADEPMDFGTTMKNDYKPWNAAPPKRANGDNKSGASGIPFGGRSGYKGDYINWGPIPVNLEKAPNTVNVIKELPFMSKTSYNNDFGDMGPTEMTRPMNKKNAKSPLAPNIPFLGETTHGKTYKPFKVSGAPLFPNGEEYEPTEAYPDQYRSLYNQDFDAPPKSKCPAKIFMESHAHPRQKYLKS